MLSLQRTRYQYTLSFVALCSMIIASSCYYYVNMRDDDSSSLKEPKQQQRQQPKLSTQSQKHVSHRNLLRLQQQEQQGQQRRLQQDDLQSNYEKVEDYDNDPFFQNILVNGTTETSLYHYLENAPVRTHLTILYWNEHGEFSRNSSVQMHGWYETVKIYEQDIEVPENVNYNGTVALLLTSDISGAVKWGENDTDIQQPAVPIISYTLPNQYFNHPYYKVIPSPYDMGHFSWNLFSKSEAEKATKTSTFQERINKIVWRGSVHGADRNRQILLDMGQDPNNNNWLDALDVDRFPDSYLWFDRMAEYKYQIDIGGESGTSWGGLRWKMCSGNLVFKVDSFAVDWWHHTLKPWFHYIPVNNNFSNIYEQYQWAENHPEEAYEIVQRGVEKCMETANLMDAIQAQKIAVQSLSLIPQSQDIIREAHAIMNGWGSFYEPIIENRKREAEEERMKQEEIEMEEEKLQHDEMSNTDG